MKKSESYTSCCFIGHRKIKKSQNLINKLYETIKELITEKNTTVFLFGSRSEFNSLCRDIVSDFKKEHNQISRIYVRAEFPYISQDYEEYLLQTFEKTYYPEKIKHSGKAVYIERNYEMIDKSDFCIFYYDENYAASTTKNSKASKSGTKIAYEYAKQKGKSIINLF